MIWKQSRESAQYLINPVTYRRLMLPVVSLLTDCKLGNQAPLCFGDWQAWNKAFVSLALDHRASVTMAGDICQGAWFTQPCQHPAEDPPPHDVYVASVAMTFLQSLLSDDRVAAGTCCSPEGLPSPPVKSCLTDSRHPRKPPDNTCLGEAASRFESRLPPSLKACPLSDAAIAVRSRPR